LIVQSAKQLIQKKEEGNAAFKAGRTEEAYKLYSEALAIDPNNIFTNSKLYFNRATVCSKVICKFLLLSVWRRLFLQLLQVRQVPRKRFFCQFVIFNHTSQPTSRELQRLGLVSDKIPNVSFSETCVSGLVSVSAQKVSCTSL